ncbi:MAG: hypothetical protein ACRDQB_04835, partial [Thermocrispum sp.]
SSFDGWAGGGPLRSPPMLGDPRRAAARAGSETDDVAEFWHRDSDTPSLSLERVFGDVTRGVHVAFAAADRSRVDAFFAAAVTAGGVPRHAPRHWSAPSLF